ncbi:MAG: acylphosphatase [Planctomycetaceae bacterium]
MQVTERIVFSGRVQGVGFRFTTRSLARRYPVTGFVRNLPDGTVELVASGGAQAVNGLVADITSHFGDNVRHVDRKPHVSCEVFDAFEVRH